MFTSKYKSKQTTKVFSRLSASVPNMTTSNDDFLQLMKRARQSRFSKSLKPDPRVPYPPYHLVPDTLKINDDKVVSYSNNMDFYKKKYSSKLYKDDITYDSFLTLQYLHRPRQLLSGYFTYSLPDEKLTNSENTNLLAWSPQALKDLDLKTPMSKLAVQVLNGTKIHNEIFPYSQVYAGFQFGQFAGQLGDGRVVNLFELPCDSGDIYELQVKGSGLTAFSRFADGKAVIRSCIREFLVSEFLHSLKIPTVRCLSVNVLSDKYAQRGSSLELCGSVTRFSQSWIRIGSFDLLRARGSDVNELKNLSDFCIENYYPDLKKLTYSDDSGNIYVKFYQEVVKRNAETVAATQVYGFLNGVLNTDNTSILGLCMDFGPFAIMDRFEPQYTPNSEDHTLRYSYENTPNAIWWNLHKLGEAIYKLFIDPAGEELTEAQVTEKGSSVVDQCRAIFEDTFFKKYVEIFGKRLGFEDLKIEEHDSLIAPMLSMLWETGLSYNKFFYYLMNEVKFDGATDNFTSSANQLLKICRQETKPPDEQNDTNIDLVKGEKIVEFLKTYKESLNRYGVSDAQRLQLAKPYNPRFVLSGWVLEEVVDDAINICRDDTDTPRSELLQKATKMSCFSTDDSRWGNELKDIEIKWCEEEESSDISKDKKKKHMLQCSCAS